MSTERFLLFTRHGTHEHATIYADAELHIPHPNPLTTDEQMLAPAIYLAGKDPANEYDLEIFDWRYQSLVKFSPLHSPVVPRWIACLFGDR